MSARPSHFSFCWYSFFLLLAWSSAFSPYPAYGAGEDTKAKGGERFFNPELAKVSYGLALLEANARYMNERDCYVRRLIREKMKPRSESQRDETSEISRLLQEEEME